MNKLKLIFFSVLGFAFFLVPYPINGESKISIAHFIDLVNIFQTQFFIFTKIVAIIVIIGTIIFRFYTSRSDLLNGFFKCNWINFAARIAGYLLYLIVLNQWFNGNKLFAMINAPETGQVMAGPGGLIPTLFITFFIGLIALPLLTHFGAVEFVGVLSANFVKKVFKVPGYSAVDAVASFVGDGTIGIVVTDTQYQRGYYSRREAYIIATSFSIVGIAFASAIAEELRLSNIFPIFYGSIALVTVIIAIITARMPLKKFKNEYYEGVEPHHMPEPPKGKNLFAHAVEMGEIQAAQGKAIPIFKHVFKQIVNVYIGFLPIIMLVGTAGLLLAEKTTLFSFLTGPLVPFYELVGFDHETAASMAPATIVGFADMYLPALLVTHLEDTMARFIIGVLAFTQLVFMSETGMVLVKSKIGLNLFDVIKVFIYRTILSLPIVLGLAFLLNKLGVI